MKRRVIAFVVVIMLILCVRPNVTAQVEAVVDGSSFTEQKVYCNATIDDDFADNRVLVVVNHVESLKFKTYNENSFEGIKCKRVENITESTGEIVKNKLQLIRKKQYNSLSESEKRFMFKNIDEDKYNQIICIELEEHDKENVLEVIKEIEKRPDVISVEPDYLISPFVFDGERSIDYVKSIDDDNIVKVAPTVNKPNDPMYDDQWAIDKIQLPDAWNSSTGSNSIKVGILDTGVDGTHPDLVNRVNVSLSRDFTNGGVDTVSVLSDPFGHGTMVAGIIGAATNNSVGVSGICWNVDMVSLRVFDSSGEGYSSYVLKAINYANQIGINVLNLSASWCSENRFRYDKSLESSINGYSGVFVCSAGNVGPTTGTGNNDVYYVYPANYRLPNLISVGASRENDRIKDNSNFGKTTVDIFAPGEEILCCIPMWKSYDYVQGYAYCGGTSFACPYIAGVAALIYATNSALDPAFVKSRIMNGVDIIYDSNGKSVFGDLCVSGGRLNAYKALCGHSAEHTTYMYSNKGVHEGHVCKCTSCNYSYEEGHTWVKIGEKYRCTKCRVITDTIPVIIAPTTFYEKFAYRN